MLYKKNKIWTRIVVSFHLFQILEKTSFGNLESLSVLIRRKECLNSFLKFHGEYLRTKGNECTPYSQFAWCREFGFLGSLRKVRAHKMLVHYIISAAFHTTFKCHDTYCLHILHWYLYKRINLATYTVIAYRCQKIKLYRKHTYLHTFTIHIVKFWNM